MPNPTPSLPVEIIRSDRRKRTVGAKVVGGRIVVRVPAGLAPGEERRLVDSVVGKIRAKLETSQVDLTARARRLASRYDLPVPESIAWSARQRQRWGSCSVGSRTIRISDRLANAPDFVIDFVIVHELAHLRVAGHGPDFLALTDRYPLAERATGYLMALDRAADLEDAPPGPAT